MCRCFYFAQMLQMGHAFSRKQESSSTDSAADASATVRHSGTSSTSLSSLSSLSSLPSVALISAVSLNTLQATTPLSMRTKSEKLALIWYESYLPVQPRVIQLSWPNSSPCTSAALEKTWQQFEKTTLTSPTRCLNGLCLNTYSGGTNKTTLKHTLK